MAGLNILLGVLVFVGGASVGSFLNVVADRMPTGRSLSKPRSFCESCGRTLTSIDLVPVVSYLVLRGRCRHCGAIIPVRLMVVEAVTGALFTIVYVRYGLELEFVVLAAAVSLLLAVALIDLEHGLILNRIVYPSAGVLIILAPFWTEFDLSRSFFGSSSMAASLANSLLAGAGAFLAFLLILIAFPRGMGAGDVKLAGLLGLLVGYPGILISVWIAIVGGGAVAIALLLLRRKGRKDAIPFGPFLAAGALVVVLAGSDIISKYQDVVGF